MPNILYNKPEGGWSSDFLPRFAGEDFCLADSMSPVLHGHLSPGHLFGDTKPISSRPLRSQRCTELREKSYDWSAGPGKSTDKRYIWSSLFNVMIEVPAISSIAERHCTQRNGGPEGVVLIKAGEYIVVTLGASRRWALSKVRRVLRIWGSYSLGPKRCRGWRRGGEDTGGD